MTQDLADCAEVDVKPDSVGKPDIAQQQGSKYQDETASTLDFPNKPDVQQQQESDADLVSVADALQQNIDKGPCNEIRESSSALEVDPPKLEVPESAFCNLPSILVPEFNDLAATPEPVASNEAEPSRPCDMGSLQACLHDLAEAEMRWGADHACVAQSLRRMAYLLECQGRRQKALPLWIRVLEIEQRYFGSQHPDVIAAETWIRGELEGSALRKDAAIAYAEQLAHSSHTAELSEDSGSSNGRPHNSLQDAAITAAATAGGVAVGGVLNLGIAAASSTSSLVMDTTGHVAHFALRKSVSRMIGVEQAELVSGVAASAGSAAMASTRAVSNAAVEAVQTVGVTAAANVTSSAISFAGHKAFDGTVWAASGARRVFRRLSMRDSDGDAGAAELQFGRSSTE